MNYKEMNNIKKIEKDVSGILMGLINEDDSNYNSIKREILAKVYELYKINSYIAMKLLDIYVVSIYKTITLGNSEDKIIEDGILVMAKNLNKLQIESDRMMSINKEMYSLVKNTYEKSYLNYLYGDATDKDMDTIETVKLYMLNCKKYRKEKK
ncbi:MAG: hypothetical protein PUB90_02900 [bacterium]|nr:hypothetical protein [bacterium]